MLGLNGNKEMNKIYQKISPLFFILSFIIICFLTTQVAFANVDKDSIFLNAQIPASELDLELLRISLRWQFLLVNSPTEEMKKEFPLITKVGVIQS